MKVVFKQDKETPKKVRFTAPEDGLVTGGVYVTKANKDKLALNEDGNLEIEVPVKEGVEA